MSSLQKNSITALLVFVLCGLSTVVWAQNYSASLIPNELLPYASAVVRNSEESVEVRDLGSTIYRIKKAITVLNKNGDGYGAIVIGYNKINSIRSVKGIVYNADGRPVAKFSERDFEDANAANDFSLFEDARVKHYAPSVLDYPYTVEYEYEMKCRQTMYFYDWQPSIATGVAVEKSTYTLSCKPDFQIRYKEMNLKDKVTVGTDKDGLKTYTWSAGLLKALRKEPYSPDPEIFLPMVKVAPVKFSYDGTAGSFTNWSELGRWVNDKLLQGRDVLPQPTIEQVKELTSGINDPKEKARKLYEFVQQKTRYISVQVGIGGFRPFPAAEVDRVNYGDCKGLVNYTKSLLKVAGIESYYCMVEAGSRKRSLMPDFASMDQGNHVILCVPFKNDTTWLECTNQKTPFGFLGDFTDDRWVIACTPQGGKLLHTPRYAAAANLTKRQATFNIDKDGQLSGQMTTVFNGTEFDDRYAVIDEPLKEQVKAIREAYYINNLDVEKMTFLKDKGAKPATTEQLTLKARDFAVNNNGRFFFTVNLANRFTGVPNEVRNRTTDVYINRGFVDEDEITYTLPEGYRMDKSLMNKKIEKPFGTFLVAMHLNGRELVFHRVLQLNDGIYGKEQYQELVDFCQLVADTDTYTAAFVKN